MLETDASRAPRKGRLRPAQADLQGYGKTCWEFMERTRSQQRVAGRMKIARGRVKLAGVTQPDSHS